MDDVLPDLDRRPHSWKTAGAIPSSRGKIQTVHTPGSVLLHAKTDAAASNQHRLPHHDGREDDSGAKGGGMGSRPRTRTRVEGDGRENRIRV